MSGSLCFIHPIFYQILPTTFISIHLPSVTASKSVLLLYNTATLCGWRAFEHHSDPLGNTSCPPPYSSMAAIFRAGAIHGLCFPLDFVNARLSSEGYVNNWVLFFSPLVIMLVIGLLCIIHSSTLLSSLLPSPFTRPPLSGDGDEEHALLGHGVREERGDLWWVISLPFKRGVMLASSSVRQLHKSAVWHQESFW